MQIIIEIDEERYNYIKNQVKEGIDNPLKVIIANGTPLKQEPCEDAPDINVGNIYKCSCGYGWDKTKVVRHHFCPNCGRAVEPSYNSIKTDLKPCEDCISRQAAIDAADDLVEPQESEVRDDIY